MIDYDFYIWLTRWVFGWSVCIFVIFLFIFIASHIEKEQDKIENYQRRMEIEHEKEGFFMNEEKKREVSMWWKRIIYIIVVFFLYIQINANHSLIMRTNTMLDQKGIKQVTSIQDSFSNAEQMDNRIIDINEELIKLDNRLNKAIISVNQWVDVIEKNRHNIKTHRHERSIESAPVFFGRVE